MTEIIRSEKIATNSNITEDVKSQNLNEHRSSKKAKE